MWSLVGRAISAALTLWVLAPGICLVVAAVVFAMAGFGDLAVAMGLLGSALLVAAWSQLRTP
jgi:hypothetical protein